MALPRYQIDPDKVLSTVRQLRARIGERFPDSGTLGQADELVKIGERTRSRIAWILRPTGKIASIYSQSFADSQAVAAVNEIETLTTGLSRKIWQKIMILQEMADGK